MRILLTGANGQVGRCIRDRAGPHSLCSLTREQLDIADLQQVRSTLIEYRPEVVVNAAAYTAVDKAEQEADKAYAVNAEGPENLARICAELQMPLIHLSTDYVFDGQATIPYAEDAVTNPIGVYGSSKLAGEQAIRACLDQHLIIRTAWVFSEYGNNFVKTMLRIGREREQLSIVEDQVGCPTYAGHIAAMILRLAERSAGSQFAHWGTYHFCGDQAVSWFQFARAIFQVATEESLLADSPELKAVTTTEYPTPAARPAYSVLDNHRLMDVLGANVERSWMQGLSQVLARL